VRTIEPSPDGTLLATASIDQTARLWDAVTLRLLATLEGGNAIVGMASFAPDGDRLLTVGFDGRARLWDTRRDGRSIDEVRAFVDCRVPLELAGGRLIPRRSPAICRK
jgi:WD40 repeat protein